MRTDRMVTVRVKSSGRVQQMYPHAAAAALRDGRVELVPENNVETAAVQPAAERAVSPAQNPAKRVIFGKKSKAKSS